MDIKQVGELITKEFGKKIIVLVYSDGNYYFGLDNDPELDFTMNIRYYNPSSNSFEIFNGMDDIPLFKKLQKLANEKNLVSSL